MDPGLSASRLPIIANLGDEVTNQSYFNQIQFPDHTGIADHVWSVRELLEAA